MGKCQEQSMNARTHTHIHTHIYIHARAHTCTHMHMHMHTRTHARTHTHTRARAFSGPSELLSKLGAANTGSLVVCAREGSVWVLCVCVCRMRLHVGVHALSRDSMCLYVCCISTHEYTTYTHNLAISTWICVLGDFSRRERRGREAGFHLCVDVTPAPQCLSLF
jgi:hypothetical protein